MKMTRKTKKEFIMLTLVKTSSEVRYHVNRNVEAWMEAQTNPCKVCNGFRYDYDQDDEPVACSACNGSGIS